MLGVKCFSFLKNILEEDGKHFQLIPSDGSKVLLTATVVSLKSAGKPLHDKAFYKKAKQHQERRRRKSQILTLEVVIYFVIVTLRPRTLSGTHVMLVRPSWKKIHSISICSRRRWKSKGKRTTNPQKALSVLRPSMVFCPAVF